MSTEAIKFQIMEDAVKIDSAQDRFDFLKHIAEWTNHKMAILGQKHQCHFLEVVEDESSDIPTRDDVVSTDDIGIQQGSED
jgi:hypothetical protein